MSPVVSADRHPAFWGGFIVFTLLYVGGNIRAQQTPTPEFPPIAPPPPFTRWAAQTRWDEAQTVENLAGWDKLKVAEAIEAWRMFLNLFPEAGRANEAAWHITSLTTRYGELPKTIAAYEQYVKDFPDGDYAESALWNVTYYYMGVPDWDKVYRVYEEFLDRFPSSPYGDVALNGLASNAMAKQRYALAIDLYQQLLQRYPSSDYCDDAWSALGAAAAAIHEPEKATEAYLTLAHQYPYSDLVQSGLMQLVLLHYSTNQPMKALKLGEEFLLTFPHSPYASTVKTYMYYASQSLGAANPALTVTLPDPYDPKEPTVVVPRECQEAYEAAQRANNLLELSRAIDLYQRFIETYPTALQVDDALYAIGQAYAKLQTYVTAAKSAKTPEQFEQVADNWRWVTEGAAAQEVIRGRPVSSAVEAYLRLTLTMIGSDLRDDALHQVGAAYEAVEDRVSAAQAYLALIRLFPVSAHAPTAVSRLNALLPSLTHEQDQATVRRAVIAAYPHHDLADDYLYELGLQALKQPDIRAARDLFAQYSRDYPNRSKAADALFWQARCEQLLEHSLEARALYADLATRFLQSGLADDGYMECEYIGRDKGETVLRVCLAELDRAAQVVGEPLLGYDAIYRDHVMILAPSDKVIDLRAYNVIDHLEQAYVLLSQTCGYQPNEGRPLVILVDAKTGAPTPGDPARMPVPGVTTPPPWRQWFEMVVSAFTSDAVHAPVMGLFPGVGAGLARFVALQFEDSLFTELGELQVGAAALARHLADLNATRGTSLAALAAHAQASATADRMDANIGLGMFWSLEAAMLGNPDEIIDWTPLIPLLQKAPSIRPDVVAAAQALEQKSALVAYWVNSALGRDFTGSLRSWGFPITAEELQKAQAAVEAPPG
ncbi:MAG: tetratricopeptide repeat protein [Candidatus Zipacnadales bacterium]